jgi:hypothetical protein
MQRFLIAVALPLASALIGNDTGVSFPNFKPSIPRIHSSIDTIHQLPYYHLPSKASD